MVKSTGTAPGAAGIVGAGMPSSFISRSSSLSESMDNRSSRSGGASALGGGMGNARQSLEKAS